MLQERSCGRGRTERTRERKREPGRKQDTDSVPTKCTSDLTCSVRFQWSISGSGSSVAAELMRA
jgi:hypothetical protein